MSDDCIFCKIGRGETATEFLYRDGHVFAICDINPLAPTHLLVIPFQHLTCLSDLNPDIELTLGRLFTVAEEMAQKMEINRTGYRLVVNQGPDSGQELPHLHMHVLGGARMGAIG